MRTMLGTVWAGLLIAFGVLLLGWVGYNLLIERLPETEGRSPRAATAFGIGAIAVGAARLRRRKA